jgi:hypothetical protein
MMEGQHFLHDARDVQKPSNREFFFNKTNALGQRYGDVLMNQAFANFQRKT